MIDGAKQLKLMPDDLQSLAASDYRYCIVQTVESSEGRILSLLTGCDQEGEARRTADALFHEIKDQYQGHVFGVGVVDTESPEYMMAYRFTLAKPQKTLTSS